MKNRFGKADLNKGATFHGEIGMFRELPRPEDISDYDKYLELQPLEIIENGEVELDDVQLDGDENGIIFNF